MLVLFIMSVVYCMNGNTSSGSCGRMMVMASLDKPNNRYGLPNVRGRRYTNSDDDVDGHIFTASRDFDLFPRKNKNNNHNDEIKRPSTSSKPRKMYDSYPPSFYSKARFTSSSSATSPSPPSGLFQKIEHWWVNNRSNVIQIRMEPTAALKIRKTFRPLGSVVRLMAEYSTAIQTWKVKSTWEDPFLGGRITLADSYIQLTKSWQLPVGVEGLVTRLRFRGAFDWNTLKFNARVGFRSERLSPINIIEGFPFRKIVNLNGKDGAIKFELKANVGLPQPELEFSSEKRNKFENIFVGMEGIEISLDELNLLIDL